MENREPILTVITPTFNRGKMLENCFKSLQRQTDNRFEWIIVDDGSTDETEKVVAGFKTGFFPIRYLKKDNGGKHTALNASHECITGKYVLILDSDDTLTEDAVENVLVEWEKYDKTAQIGVVTFYRGKNKETPLCTAKDIGIPVDIMRYKRNSVYSSDCCEVIRTSLFKKYPFPIFEGERFVSECALWNRVSFTHKCVYIDKVVYLCEYLEGGLTKSGRKMRIQNPHGGMYTANLNMDRKNYFLRQFKNGMLFICYGFFAEMQPKEMAEVCRNKPMMWLCFPGGRALFYYWSKKYSAIR